MMLSTTDILLIFTSHWSYYRLGLNSKHSGSNQCMLRIEYQSRLDYLYVDIPLCWLNIGLFLGLEFKIKQNLGMVWTQKSQVIAVDPLYVV